jgi:hypothetical protein
MRSPTKDLITRTLPFVTAPLSTLPAIAACALLGATDASAATCTAARNSCQPYVATIQQVEAHNITSGPLKLLVKMRMPGDLRQHRRNGPPL